MKKLLKLTPWLAAFGIAWSLGFAYNLYFGGRMSWLRAMYFNKLQLVNQVEGERRLLIVGGSGAHYTVNSELLEQELGFPVFNLGLDGNLGLNVIFPLILEQVRPNDIVLVIPEYLMLNDEDGIGERSGPFGIAIGQPSLGGVPPKQLAEDVFRLGVPELRRLSKSAVDIIQKVEIPDYYADPITKRGDPTKTWPRHSRWRLFPIEQSITDHSVERIEQFRQEVEAKGATLVLSLPIVLRDRNPETVKNVQETAQKLEKIAPLIYNRESLNVKTDTTLFADTEYHLKPEGRVIRSQEIVEQLQPILETLN